MTDSELQTLTRQIAKEYFGQDFPYPVYFNARLKTTGGRYHLNDHHIDINPLMLTEFDEENLIGVIKHELAHYFIHERNEVPSHQNPHFKQLLKAVGGLRYAPITSKKQVIKKRWVYQCKNCGQEYHRVKRINTRRYRCGKCHGLLTLVV